MKKRILLGAGAAILVAFAAFTTKASMKFANASKLYFTSGNACSLSPVVTITPSSAFVTQATAAHQAIINTAGGTQYKLYATSTCTDRVAFAN